MNEINNLESNKKSFLYYETKISENSTRCNFLQLNEQNFNELYKVLVYKHEESESSRFNEEHEINKFYNFCSYKKVVLENSEIEKVKQFYFKTILNVCSELLKSRVNVIENLTYNNLHERFLNDTDSFSFLT